MGGGHFAQISPSRHPYSVEYTVIRPLNYFRSRIQNSARPSSYSTVKLSTAIQYGISYAHYLIEEKRISYMYENDLVRRTTQIQEAN